MFTECPTPRLPFASRPRSLARSIEPANAARSRAFDDRLRRPPRLPCARSLCFGSLVSALDSAAPSTATTNARATALPRVPRALFVILIVVVVIVVVVDVDVDIDIDVVLIAMSSLSFTLTIFLPSAEARCAPRRSTNDIT